MRDQYSVAEFASNAQQQVGAQRSDVGFCLLIDVFSGEQSVSNATVDQIAALAFGD
jgi:hypothetical protein